jgi:hypothetical protein
MSEHQGKGTGGLQWLVRAYLARRYTILFYSLLLTLGAGPLLAALHLDDRLLQLFLALNLLAAVLGVSDRRFSGFFLLLVGAALMVRLAAVPLHAEALAKAGLALWTVIGLLAAAGAVRFAMRGAAVSAEHLYAALSAYLLAGLARRGRCGGGPRPVLLLERDLLQFRDAGHAGLRRRRASNGGGPRTRDYPSGRRAALPGGDGRPPGEPVCAKRAERGGVLSRRPKACPADGHADHDAGL